MTEQRSKATIKEMDTKALSDAKDMLDYFTRKAVETDRADKKAEYQSFIRQWKLTLTERQNKWNRKYETKLTK